MSLDHLAHFMLFLCYIQVNITIHINAIFDQKFKDNRPIANMGMISPKRRFSVATVANGWSLVYMLMRVRYLVVFSLWKQ